MPDVEIEDVAKDMAAFLSEAGLQKQFEEWMLRRGHDQATVDAYNELVETL